MDTRRDHGRTRGRGQRPPGRPATDRLARAFYTDLFANAGNQRNLARFNFLDPASRRFYPDWERFADMAVAILRREAGRDPYDKDLHDLIGELSTRSEQFRARWGAHNVRRHGTGTKRFHHPAVGDLTLAFESLDLAAEPGLHLTIYTAEPGSPSEEGPAPVVFPGGHRRSQPGRATSLTAFLVGRPRVAWSRVS